MKPHTDNVVERPGDLTADWLTAAVGAGNIADFSVERIGTGQMSECYRLQLTYADRGPGDGPDSVVLKVAATDRRSSAMKSAAPQSNRLGSRSPSWPGCRARCSVTPRLPMRRG